MVTTDALAARLAPQLVAGLEAHREEIVAKAGNMIERAITRRAFPRFLDAVPTLTEMAVESIRREFGTMDLNDLLDFLGKRPGIARDASGPSGG